MKSALPSLGAGSEDTEIRIYHAIVDALLGGKLRPGMPLRERNLAQAFGTTRGAVRKVLSRLGVEGKLVLEHNRGASVPQPSAEDIRQVYRARQVLEQGVMLSLSRALDAHALQQLRDHVGYETAAYEDGDRQSSIRLAGEFHLLLTRLTESADLLAFARQLVAKTELFKALYDPVEYVSCAPREHMAIVEALAAGNAEAALALMHDHIHHLQERVLRQARIKEKTPDLATLFTAQQDGSRSNPY